MLILRQWLRPTKKYQASSRRRRHAFVIRGKSRMSFRRRDFFSSLPQFARLLKLTSFNAGWKPYLPQVTT
jgi:hypothetical protein